MTYLLSLPIGLFLLLSSASAVAAQPSDAPTTMAIEAENMRLQRPDESVTRIELVALIVEQAEQRGWFDHCFEVLAPSLPVKYTLLFSDIGIDHPFAKEICVAMVSGLIDGYSDGSFRPNDTVTTAAASKIISRAYNIYEIGRRDPAWMPWYAQYTDPMHAHHAIPESAFSPAKLLTRSEVSQMLFALHEKTVMLEQLRGRMWTEPTVSSSSSLAIMEDSASDRRVLPTAPTGQTSSSSL